MVRRVGVALGLACHLAVTAAVLQAQTPPPLQPAIAEGPAITVLKGLTVPQFETEMRHFVQAVGVNCGGCHTRGNFASEDNPRKAKARQMIEMTKRLNQRYFAAYVPADDESTLGRVTCYTCHLGETSPTSAPAPKP
jgi:Photosynthetic reaction centre cytochrome C subunit